MHLDFPSFMRFTTFPLGRNVPIEKKRNLKMIMFEFLQKETCDIKVSIAHTVFMGVLLLAKLLYLAFYLALPQCIELLLTCLEFVSYNKNVLCLFLIANNKYM